MIFIQLCDCKIYEARLCDNSPCFLQHPVYLSLPFPFQHVYAPDEISSVYGRKAKKLSPTLAAFVNGVAVSIDKWSK